MNKKHYIAAAVIALVGATIIGAGQVSAQGMMGGDSTFVQQLAQKLGVDQTKVQTAVDEIHETRHAEMEKRLEERLSQAVTDGKITDAQKTLILQKHDELEKQHEADREKFQSMTPEERRAEMETRKTELETWAKDNGIDLQNFFFQGRMGHGMRHGWK